MKRYSSIMSVLIALALPVAGFCADAPATPTTKGEVNGETKSEVKGDTKAEASPDAKAKAEKAEAVKDSMSKSKHGSMMSGKAASAESGSNPSGKVVQTMSAGGYSYANLEKDGKNTWVAYSPLETKVGDSLSFSGCVEMTKFESKALNRTFDSIFFCGPPEVKSTNRKAAKTSPGSGGASASAGKIKVEKATGANAYTISEIFAKRSTLSGKRVVVKGQVVKVSAGIMNRNWLHLQDGTGSEKQKTHDLVVTSSELADVGDVVTVSGTVAKDKDFGGGYKYVVIIEKGNLKK